MNRPDPAAQPPFLPAVDSWFRRQFEAPTPPQRLAWPIIAAGESVLLVAPTGSGKTLAAFLACLDHLWRFPRQQPGVRILYISPLKALNEDIARNLQLPLEGILEASRALNQELPALTVGVRTGDTTTAERQKLIRHPPDILITTPESLHLMLTSRARSTFEQVSHVIVDEIHAVAATKRGVFLALLLERLQALQERQFQRIGLSATQRPLEEVARYLGGSRKLKGRFVPRPVTIIDAGRRKQLDLEVSLPASSQGPAASIWPAIEARLQQLIADHRSTIIFANNRRVAERLTARLNETDNLADDEPADLELPETVHSHHGSLSLDRRRATEELLKSGNLKAVVATASLELGIDMGAVELVCQVESPGSVSRGLQRVGRAGHLVGQTSKGRLIAKTPRDLLESAALARAMVEGRIEALRVPTNCLDVLAQQVVACVAVGSWKVPALFDLVRQAYPYQRLSPAAFESVLELVSGRFEIETFRDLRPRISWDRIRNRLEPLPGTASLAITGGGTIPDTGQFPVYLGEGGPRLGELDEEFVLERRVGEVFVLGSSTWSIEAIEPHRVLVSSAAGREALTPFWRGEAAHRTAELGQMMGTLCREIADRPDSAETEQWLVDNYRLDRPSARSLYRHVMRQYHMAGTAPDDHTLLVETFRDPAGELGLAVLTTFGGKLHHALKLLLLATLRRRLGISLTALHGDDGVLIRLPGSDQPPRNLFRDLNAESAEKLILEELGDSALFGLRFRQSAGRALLLPRPQPGRRTPLWLQRLRSKDLLQAVRQVPDFPIVVETYRECLEEDLNLPLLRDLLTRIQAGDIQVIERQGEQPSPFTAGLVFEFTSKFLYEWDEPRRAEPPDRGKETSDHLLQALLSSAPVNGQTMLDDRAVDRVNDHLRYAGKPPRSPQEMFERLRLLGDLEESELAGPMLGFLDELVKTGQVVQFVFPNESCSTRWISAEEHELYESAFSNSSTPEAQQSARSTILKRYLRTHALIGRAELMNRYPLSGPEAEQWLEQWVSEGLAVKFEGPLAQATATYWADPRNLTDARRLTLALRRKEAIAVTPEVYSEYLLKLHHVDPRTRREGSQAVHEILDQLQGHAASAVLWETEILPRRISDFRPAWLDAALGSGGWTWRAQGTPTDLKVALVTRDFEGAWPLPEESETLAPDEQAVLDSLRNRGALFPDELATATGLEPSRVRQNLQQLVARGLLTNDRFDPFRISAQAMDLALSQAAARPSSAASSRRRIGRARPRASSHPEGRWLALSEPATDPEASVQAWATVLLERFGVLCRETASLDLWAPPWRDLFPTLDRAEARGEIRRGYFVEGLSGIQFAWPETVDELARHASERAREEAPYLLVSSLDPANLYGSGAPFDIPLLEGGTVRLNRTATSHLVLRGGRPLLVVEGRGRRLTGLASASEAELREAVKLLKSLAAAARGVLRVETYNLAPVLGSPAAPWLLEAGFVRDMQGLVYYDSTWL